MNEYYLILSDDSGECREWLVDARSSRSARSKARSAFPGWDVAECHRMDD